MSAPEERVKELNPNSDVRLTLESLVKGVQEEVKAADVGLVEMLGRRLPPPLRK